MFNLSANTPPDKSGIKPCQKWFFFRRTTDLLFFLFMICLFKGRYKTQIFLLLGVSCWGHMDISEFHLFVRRSENKPNAYHKEQTAIFNSQFSPPCDRTAPTGCSRQSWEFKIVACFFRRAFGFVFTTKNRFVFLVLR